MALIRVARFLSQVSIVLEGDLANIPTAPDWLLAEMKQPPRTINKKELDFTDRTQDEIAANYL